VITKRVDSALLDEFDEFLKTYYSSRKSSRKPIVSAVRTMLETGKGPDELPLTTKSRSKYRKALRLWKKFLAYREADEREVIAIVRSRGMISEDRLKKLLKNNVDFDMAVLKAVSSGSLYVVHDKNRRLMWVGD